ncbi:MAG: DUF1351 domain-containing protein [bacterium]
MSTPTTADAAEHPVTTEIAEYSQLAAALHDLYTRHASVVHDCTTTSGMKACRAARAEIRTCRTSLEAKRKEIKAPALERCRLIDADAKRITEALLAIEEPLDAQIKSEEDAAEARREAKHKAEAERLARLRCLVEEISSWPLAAVGASADQLRKQVRAYEATNLAYLPEEIREEGAAVAEEALRKLREMIEVQEAKEAEDARLAADRAAESERQAAEDKRLREERRRHEEEKTRLLAELRMRAEEQAEAHHRLAEERARMLNDLLDMEKRRASLKEEIREAEEANRRKILSEEQAAEAERALPEAEEFMKLAAAADPGVWKFALETSEEVSRCSASTTVDLIRLGPDPQDTYEWVIASRVALLSAVAKALHMFDEDLIREAIEDGEDPKILANSLRESVRRRLNEDSDDE